MRNASSIIKRDSCRHEHSFVASFLEDFLMLAVVVAFVAAVTFFGQDIAALTLALQGRA